MKEAIWNPPASALRCAGTTCVLFDASRTFTAAVGYRLAHASYLFPLRNLSNNAALKNFILRVMVTQVGRWKGSPQQACPPPTPRSPTIKDAGLCTWVHFQDCELGPFSKGILIASVARRLPWESPDLHGAWTPQKSVMPSDGLHLLLVTPEACTKVGALWYRASG